MLLLMVDDKIEIERHDIVSDFQRVPKMKLVVPFAEQVLVINSEFIESNLGQTQSIITSNDSGPEIGLLYEC